MRPGGLDTLENLDTVEWKEGSLHSEEMGLRAGIRSGRHRSDRSPCQSLFQITVGYHNLRCVPVRKDKLVKAQHILSLPEHLGKREGG